MEERTGSSCQEPADLQPEGQRQRAGQVHAGRPRCLVLNPGELDSFSSFNERFFFIQDPVLLKIICVVLLYAGTEEFLLAKSFISVLLLPI